MWPKASLVKGECTYYYINKIKNYFNRQKKGILFGPPDRKLKQEVSLKRLNILE